MKKWEIWNEGYLATGEYCRAFLMGVVEAKTFSEACQKLANKEGWGNLFKPAIDGGPSFWMCRLFDNEVDARVFVDDRMTNHHVQKI